MERDEVIQVCGNLANAVCQANLDAIEGELSVLADAYGVDIKGIVEGIHAMNDVGAHSTQLAADSMCTFRVAGTLFRNLADIMGCVYDIDTGLEITRYIHDMSATVLVAKGAYAILRDRPIDAGSAAGASVEG